MIFLESEYSEKLKKYIDNKKIFISKQTNQAAARILQKEIIFLENEILPIVQMHTEIDFYTVQQYSLLSYREAIKKNCNALITVFPMKADYVNFPLVAIANEYQHVINYPQALTVEVDKLRIYNQDGNGDPEDVDCCPITIKPY